MLLVSSKSSDPIHETIRLIMSKIVPVIQSIGEKLFIKIIPFLFTFQVSYGRIIVGFLRPEIFIINIVLSNPRNAKMLFSDFLKCLEVCNG